MTELAVSAKLKERYDVPGSHVQAFSSLSRRSNCSLPFFLTAHFQALFFNFLTQFENPLDQCLRTGRAAGDIDIDRHYCIDTPLRYHNYRRTPHPSWRDFPMLITHFGSGICSHSRCRRGPILTGTVPATIIRSAWRGLERNTSSQNERDHTAELLEADCARRHP